MSGGAGGGPKSTKIYHSLVLQGQVWYPRRPTLGLMEEPCKLLKHRHSPGQNKDQQSRGRLLFLKCQLESLKLLRGYSHCIRPELITHSLRPEFYVFCFPSPYSEFFKRPFLAFVKPKVKLWFSMVSTRNVFSWFRVLRTSLLHVQFCF